MNYCCFKKKKNLVYHIVLYIQYDKVPKDNYMNYNNNTKI